MKSKIKFIICIELSGKSLVGGKVVNEKDHGV